MPPLWKQFVSIICRKRACVQYDAISVANLKTAGRHQHRQGAGTRAWSRAQEKLKTHAHLSPKRSHFQNAPGQPTAVVTLPLWFPCGLQLMTLTTVWPQTARRGQPLTDHREGVWQIVRPCWFAWELVSKELYAYILRKWAWCTLPPRAHLIIDDKSRCCLRRWARPLCGDTHIRGIGLTHRLFWPAGKTMPTRHSRPLSTQNSERQHVSEPAKWSSVNPKWSIRL